MSALTQLNYKTESELYRTFNSNVRLSQDSDDLVAILSKSQLDILDTFNEDVIVELNDNTPTNLLIDNAILSNLFISINRSHNSKVIEISFQDIDINNCTIYLHENDMEKFRNGKISLYLDFISGKINSLNIFSFSDTTKDHICAFKHNTDKIDIFEIHIANFNIIRIVAQIKHPVSYPIVSLYDCILYNISSLGKIYDSIHTHNCSYKCVSKLEVLKRIFEYDDEGFFVYKTFDEYYSSPDYWIIEPGSCITEMVDYNNDKRCTHGINVGNLHFIRYNTSKLEVWKCKIKYEDLIDCVLPDETIDYIMLENQDKHEVKMRCYKIYLIESYSRPELFEL